MLSAGELGKVVHQQIADVCRDGNPQHQTGCVQAVTHQVEKQIEIICQLKSLYDGITAPVCQQRLGSLLWTDPGVIATQLRMPQMAGFIGGIYPLWTSSLTRHTRLATLIQEEARAVMERLKTPAPQSKLAAIDTGKILWQQPLALAQPKFEFTHIGEWRTVQTEIDVLRDGKQFHKKVEWSYKLQPNEDSSYTVFFSAGKKSAAAAAAPAAEGEESLVFRLKDGQYPAALMLTVYGVVRSSDLKIEGVQLSL